jgi:hypothetical protein
VSLTYEWAAAADGEEVAALLESVVFKGGIALTYGRRPNAVLSLARDGEKSAVCVVRDNGRIVATGACVINTVDVRGVPRIVAYLTGMRAVQHVNIPKAYAMVRAFCRENAVEYTYTTILKDNAAVRRMLEKRRACMPDYVRHSTFRTNVVKTGLKVRDGNVLSPEGGTYALRDEKGDVVASGRALEQWDYKQYTVKKYSGKYRLLKRALRWMPDEGEVLRFFALSRVRAKDDASLGSFLRHVSNIDTACAFFIHGGDTCPVPHLTYESLVYLVDWDKKGVPDEVMNGALPLEVALL